MAGINSCLGICFDKELIRYARLDKSNDGSITIKNHSVKFVKEQSVEDTLFSVISETNSMDIPVVMNALGTKYSDFKILKQISNSDRNNIAKLEFEEWCDKNMKNSETFTYVQSISDVIEEEHHSGVVAIAEKATITKFQEIKSKKISAMYPTELLFGNTADLDEPNYILVNLDNLLTITTIINGKKVSDNIYDIGMVQILNAFMDLLGSYPKSYEACKQMNVFADGETSTNKLQFEQIVEPVLQEVLQKVQEVIEKHRSSISKVYITGMGTLFTNLDTLFTEYFNIRCEIFKPKIVSEIGDVRDMASILEVLPAIELARTFMNSPKDGIDFIKVYAKNNMKFADKLKGIFAKTKSTTSNAKKTSSKKFTLDFTKVEKILAYPTAAIVTYVVGYNVFTNVYMNKMDSNIEEYKNKIAEYDSTITTINTDISMIAGSTSKYRNVNDQINNLINQVQNNEIGKYTTYNIATFTQKLASIVPKDVVLKYIESDDKKHVIISAEAASYPDIGYFVASLRLSPDILKEVSIESVQNGSTITVVIGGDLP